MITNREPAMIVGTITAIVAALITFAKAFGVHLTDDQQEAIRNLVAVLAPLVAALIIRGLVYSKNSVENKVSESFKDGQQGAMEPPEVL